ncbi:hypothetical protein GCM10011351_13740 [Paraliobacillus quinghaiensis]|uniref:DUF3231 family protein n=1 Tax=Paraliobacillus quinghaiensis TaxID=470815 RepID=A0A917TNK6_9BACI|nr:DUF3231 family protein [Paraliobacillus quinghaiensis]GGM28962.1 hypothetical protein GCM10011351_13740 [Paraliobacillus quinghaiensis]
MSSPESVKLTSSEMASLWQEYISHTHSNCMLKYFIAKAEDNEVLNVLTKTNQRIKKIRDKTKQILESENVPVPVGFSNQDVDMNAPRLFSDSFALLYIKNLSRVNATSCSLMHTMSTRKDIRKHFKECSSEGITVFDEISDLLLDKGLYVRPPFIEPPKKSDFIEDRDYLNGFNLLGDQRFLNTIEISHIFGNVEANVVGNTITKSFGQTADKKEVRDFMKKAGKLSEKVVNTLTKFLTSSQLPTPMPSETQVVSSSQPAFSDRLMMYQLSILTAAGLSDYATSLATSMRNDLKRQYMDLLDDTAKLGGEAQNLMIDNSWLEQPPQQDKIIQ